MKVRINELNKLKTKMHKGFSLGKLSAAIIFRFKNRCGMYAAM